MQFIQRDKLRCVSYKETNSGVFHTKRQTLVLFKHHQTPVRFIQRDKLRCVSYKETNSGAFQTFQRQTPVHFKHFKDKLRCVSNISETNSSAFQTFQRQSPAHFKHSRHKPTYIMKTNSIVFHTVHRREKLCCVSYSNILDKNSVVFHTSETIPQK